MLIRCAALGLTATLTLSAPALALDKQGSAHNGDVSGPDHGFDVSGSFSLGSAIVNPTYAARPDNSGKALFRYAAHADVDLIGSRLSIPLDLNVFTDRTRGGALRFAPSEFDWITGLTTTQRLGRAAALELGARIEHDQPVDRGHYTQTYIDSRGRLLYSLAKLWQGLDRSLAGGDISGYLTLGWFAVNHTYAARPDNSGLALMRYAAHEELALLDRRLAFAVDTTLFTDRRSSQELRPSELDLTYEIIGRSKLLEFHLALERDMPLDRGNFVQTLLYGLVVCPFDLGLHAELHRAEHEAEP